MLIKSVNFVTFFVCTIIITIFQPQQLLDAARIEDFFSEPSSDSRLANNFSSSGSPLIWQPLRASFRPLNRQPINSIPAAPISIVASAFDQFDPPTTTTSTAAPPTQPAFNLDDEDLPTRVPLNRFRPTRPPSVDPQTQPQPFASPLQSGSGSSNSNAQHSSNSSSYRISQECFECICEASTSCNANSRCQTSDVRHTRCGLFLINYDQWLETGLSRQLVTREALARDAAADERAFYECVTDRDCAERLLAIYMQRKAIDCDKDGRIDCYDVAAIHQGGTDQCASESLLDSQYWSDFNACFGFGR